MTRRSAGSKRQLEPDLWMLQVSAGHDIVTGKRRRVSKRFQGTEREAELELARMLADTGRHGSTAMTFWEFLETVYLPAIAPPGVRQRTYDGYVSYLERYVRPMPIASVRLDRLDRYAFVAWMRQVQQRVANKQTQRHIYAAVSAALGRAVKWGYLEENMLRKAVDAPRPDEYHPAILTLEEANDYLDAFAGSELEPVVVLGIAGGFRPSEILGLDWSDIDFELGAAKTWRGMHQTKARGVYYEDNKSRGSRRVVFLPEWALDALLPHRGIGPLMGSLTPWQVRYRYKRYVTDAKLTPWCAMENLRHTSATLGIEAGMDWVDMAHRLGHSDMKMVQERYAKRRLLRDQQAAKPMGELRRVQPGNGENALPSDAKLPSDAISV